MGIKSTIIKPFAKKLNDRIDYNSKNAISIQKETLIQNVKFAQNTLFGKDHHFKDISDYKSYKNNIPLKDYEGIKNYIEKVKTGNSNILWPGKPKYFVGTSGTTSGIKYIPLSKESMPFHLNSARNAVLSYAYRNGIIDMMDDKLIFLSGSPELDRSGPVPIGRLSGIINHEIPWWLKPMQVPSFETNCIKDWQQKIEAIVKETKDLSLSMISGITPWVVMYMEELLAKTGKENIKEVFPNFKIMVHGGVNYRPYAPKLNELTGASVHHLETYPASEGFVAFQTERNDPSLQLNIGNGIFYEFIPKDQVFNDNPDRFSLEEIELDTDYALVINSNAGLWSYLIGDLVRFVSKDPYKLVFAGRYAHYISAFGEHVIERDVNNALIEAMKKTSVKVKEFHVAPYISNSEDDDSHHEWFIEFDNRPSDIQAFVNVLDLEMQKANFQYGDLIRGKVIKRLKLRLIEKNGFRDYMASINKLGGQNKVPRLSNNRKIAEGLLNFVVS